MPDLIAGRYRVERAVGRGGMGTVWLCTDEVLGRQVAVKQIGALPGESAASTARAMREARSAAALNHENAVVIYDIVDHDDAPWLVMEYVPSRTLSDLLAEVGRLSPARVARIGAQLAAALNVAHAVGISHRDIKPGNVLIGADDLAKISDFGIARAAHDERVTQTGMVTGTPAYFSPELAKGAEAGPASDVWALGATLYEAIEGRPAYEHEGNPLATLQRIVTEAAPPPRHAGPLTDVLRELMMRDPDDRATMAQALARLRAIAPTLESNPVGYAAAPPDPKPAATSAPPTRQTPHPAVHVTWSAEPPPRAAGPVASSPGLAPRATGASPASASPAGSANAPSPASAPPASSGAASTGYGDGDRARRRLPAMALAVGIAALLLLGVGGYLLSGRSTDDGSPASTEDRAPVADDRTAQTDGPGRDGPATPSPSPQPQGPQRPTRAAFVDAYFDALPDDTDAGWARLAPSMQAVGRGEYESFWGSIDAVETAGATAVGGGSVRVQITYTFSDGRVVAEDQELSLRPQGDGYLITNDEVLNSTTVSQ